MHTWNDHSFPEPIEFVRKGFYGSKTIIQVVCIRIRMTSYLRLEVFGQVLGAHDVLKTSRFHRSVFAVYSEDGGVDLVDHSVVDLSRAGVSTARINGRAY